MDYSLSQVATAADCDLLLQIAATEKADLDFKRQQQTRAHASIAAGTTNVEAELMAVNTEISGLETVVATLPPGDTLAEFESRLTKLRHKKFLLEERRERYSLLSMIQKEYLVNCIETQVTATNAYIDAIQQRKEEIG